VYGETSDDVLINGKIVNSIEIDNENYIITW
jgi:hypothetical protein